MILGIAFVVYSLSLAIFGKEIGLLFATIFLALFIALVKLSELTGLDKWLDKWI